MGNPLLALLGGLGQGMVQAKKQKTEEEYKKSLIEHIKTQAKLDEQKINLMIQEGQLAQTKHTDLMQALRDPQAFLRGGGEMPPKNPKALMPGGIIQPQSGGYSAVQQQLGGGVVPQSWAAAMAVPNEIAPIIQQASQDHGVPPNLISAIINAESKFNPEAVSPKGAQGLMQLMPETAQGLGVTNPLDPQQNVAGGSRYIKAMLQKYNGNLPMALAAYNWGPGNVDKYGMENMPAETKNYIGTVMGQMQGGQGQGGLVAPVSGKITSGYGATRDNGARQHMAGDIAAPAGSPFVAPTDLKITQTRQQMSDSPGGMVWGVDKSGVEHRFIHTNPGVKVGDVVKQGQPLGTISDINGPHLHYAQVNPQGEKINWMQGSQGNMNSSAGQQYAQAGGQTASDQTAMPSAGQMQAGSGAGQMQGPGGPQTAPGGKPLLSDRDRLSIALQYLGGVKLPDGKTPLKIDVGDRIEVRDPDNPNTIYTTILKTPDTITVPRTDDSGRKWNEYYTQPRPGQQSQFLGKIQVEPGAAQQGSIEGTKDTVKSSITGETPEVAGKINLVRNATEKLPEIEALLFNPKDGSPNEKIIRDAAMTGPSGAGVGEARTLYSKMYQAIDAALRVETGAQATPNEIQAKMAEFWPTLLDLKLGGPGVVKEKFKDLSKYINGLPGVMKGKGAFKLSSQTQQTAPKTVERTGVHNGKKVIQYSDGTIDYAN